jgi:hypothetical protein
MAACSKVQRSVEQFTQQWQLAVQAIIALDQMQHAMPLTSIARISSVAAAIPSSTLAPSTSIFGTVLLCLPFAFAKHFDTRTIY